jgi:hypothetical protein
VANLPNNVTPEEVEAIFTPTCIMDMRPIRHRESGRLRGVFVDFDTSAALMTALRRDGTVVRGRPAMVRPDGAGRQNSLKRQISPPQAQPIPHQGSMGSDGAPIAPSTPPARPKLVLAKRSASAGAPNAAVSSPAASSRPNPFGDAKPINNNARLLELERKDAEKKARKQEAQQRIQHRKASHDALIAQHAAAAAEAVKLAAAATQPVTLAPEKPNAAAKQLAVAQGLAPAVPKDSWEEDDDIREVDGSKVVASNPYALLSSE